MNTPRLILVVENEKDDILLLKHAMKKAGINNPLHVVESGEEAVAYLNGHGEFKDRSRHPIPAVVLLDLKLRGLDGVDVLRWIRQQSFYPTLPVVILSASILSTDISEAYRSGANSYIVKVADPVQLAETMTDFARWWLQRNMSPV